MRMNRLGLLALAVVSALIASPIVTAGDETGTKILGQVERAEANHATELLNKAEDYLRKNGQTKAFAAFNNPKGPFVKGPYYVFAVGEDGFMHANGGSPSGLAGKNALNLRDAAGKPLIRELLEKAKSSPTGTIEYRWLNRVSNHVENKVSQFRKVGNVILCAGYYTPRASLEDTQALLDKAVQFLKTSGGEAAYTAFNNPKGGFMHDDQYVFVIGLEDGKYRAYGATPELTGKDVRGLHDAAGSPLVEEMIALAKDKGKGTVEYVWRNPATNAVERKHSLIQRVDDVLVGVGYYVK